MSCQASNVLHRNTKWYFRQWVPGNLQSKLQLREIKRVLPASDLQSARSMAKLLTENLKGTWDMLKELQLSPAQARMFINRELTRFIAELEEPIGSNVLHRPINNEEIRAYTEFASEKMAVPAMRLKHQDFYGRIYERLQQENICYSEHETHCLNLRQGNRIVEELLRGQVELCSALIEGLHDPLSDHYEQRKEEITKAARLDIDDDLNPNNLFQNPTETLGKWEKGLSIQYAKDENKEYRTTSAIPVLKELAEAFIRENRVSQKWVETTEAMYQTLFRLWFEHFGEEYDIRNLTRAQYIDFFENVLQRIPKNWKKKFPDKTLQDAVKLTNVPCLAGKTLKNYHAGYNAFLGWCVIQEYIVRNPIETFTYHPTPSSQKPVYSEEDVGKIIDAMGKWSFTGIGGNKKTQLRWIVLFGMMHGCREGEICQLMIDDIGTNAGIPCFRIHFSEERKTRTKTEQSQRLVPIHPILLKLGFLQYWQHRKSECEKHPEQEPLLFPFLTRTKDGKYTRNFYNAYSKFNANLFADTKKTFHSFRHRAITVLLDQGASLPLVQGIVGHFEGSDKSVTVRSYYHPQLEAKLQVLKLMPYPENLASRLKMCESSDKQIAEQITSLQVIEGV